MADWNETIYLGAVFHAEELTFLERRDAIVVQIKRSAWYADSDDTSELHDLVDLLADAPTADKFNEYWVEFYDMADWGRIFIDTVSYAGAHHG